MMTIDWNGLVNGVLITVVGGLVLALLAGGWRVIRSPYRRITRPSAQELREGERATRLAEIEDTRALLLDLAKGASAIADGRILDAQKLLERINEDRFPHFRPELIAYEPLVDELCTTVPEVFEASGRVRDDLRGRAHTLANTIRKAFRQQEELVRRTGEPQLRTSEQDARLSVGVDRVNAALRRYEGPAGTLRGLWIALRRW